MTGEQLIPQLLQQYGSLGLVMGIAAYALRYLHNQLVEAQEKRIADAQQSTTHLLRLVDEQHKQITILTAAMNSSTEANHELRVVIEQALADRLPPPRAARRPGT